MVWFKRYRPQKLSATTKLIIEDRNYWIGAYEAAQAELRDVKRQLREKEEGSA